VVFRDPGNLNGEVVHLHLEHRLVQRLLGRFLSMGFRQDDLCRACVLRTDAAEPRVLLLGRLSLYGEGGARLHDEVLAAAAYWQPPEQRAGRGLRPLGETDKAEVLRMLEFSLTQPRLTEEDPHIARLLKSHAGQDVVELTSHLERRSKQLSERAERELLRRGEAEALEMASILQSQRERILARQKELEEEDRQQRLGFDPDEARQLAADRAHWRRRLETIAQELGQEPERIRRSYVVVAPRLEPVGLVYLWPLSS
jgi:hypothetical protein